MDKNDLFSETFSLTVRTALYAALDCKQVGLTAAWLTGWIGLDATNDDDVMLVRIAVRNLCPDVQSVKGRLGGYRRRETAQETSVAA